MPILNVPLVKIRFVYLAVSWFLLVSCGFQNKKENNNAEFRYPQVNGQENPRNYNYECEYPDYVTLPAVPENYATEFCPANGNLLPVDGDAGYLDNCPFVRYVCAYDEYYGVMALRHLLLKCLVPPATGICKYKEWSLKHCFKFFDDSGRKCECDYGEVLCDKQH